MSLRTLACGKLLIDGADLQANVAVVSLMEDLLLFAGSSGLNAGERRQKSSNWSG